MKNDLKLPIFIHRPQTWRDSFLHPMQMSVSFLLRILSPYGLLVRKRKLNTLPYITNPRSLVHCNNEAIPAAGWQEIQRIHDPCHAHHP